MQPSLVQRLRDSVTQCRALDRSQLLTEAADEIERLRQQSNQTGGEFRSVTLTDAEREAVRFCVTASLPEVEKLGGVAGELCRMHAATLRGLLERLK